MTTMTAPLAMGAEVAQLIADGFGRPLVEAYRVRKDGWLPSRTVMFTVTAAVSAGRSGINTSRVALAPSGSRHRCGGRERAQLRRC